MGVVQSLVGWNQLVAAALAIVVWLAYRTPALRRRPSLAHALWFMVLATMLLPPLAWLAELLKTTTPVAATGVARPLEVCDPTSAPVQPAEVQLTKVSATCESTSTQQNAATGLLRSYSPANWSSTGNLTTWLLAISTLGTAVHWTTTAWRFRRINRLLKLSRCGNDARLRRLLADVSERFGICSSIRLRIVDAPISPMLWRVPGQSAIVLPHRIAVSASDDALRAVFAHELAHYCRRDHWTQLFGFGVASLFWWNPLPWIARRQMAAAAESCCDALALERLQGSRKSYASTLLTVVDSLSSSRWSQPAFGVTFGDSRSLVRRFELIADTRVAPRLSRRGWVVLFIVFVGIALAMVSVDRAAARVAALPDGGTNVVAPLYCCPQS